MAQATEFNAIRISLASPEQIKSWSYGEITKPETINYRTLRPEKDGLFCERIFGPTKDWECYCGKYKKIRYKGVICDRCGVEVTRAKVRRERMGHITLAAPVAHIWFAKGAPSRVGLLLDISPRNLERVLYFAQYIIVSVDEKAKKLAIEELKESYPRQVEEVKRAFEEQVAALGAKAEEQQPAQQDEKRSRKKNRARADEQAVGPNEKIEAKIQELTDELQERIAGVEDLRPLQLLTESSYRDLRDRLPGAFKAGMGAEAILEILRGVDLETVRSQLQGEVASSSGQRRKKAIKRLRVVEAFRKSNNKPEWMILTILPVLPPELRPMVQLDGGRFATSDLNDLYRRVINRNNRLKRLLELGAPEIIVRNEKRMLQEAVDALIDNGRRGRAVAGSHNHKLKSLTDLLRGKQGRFRQNLLGKRVDYSGRSVIVVGPKLRLDQCGLPKRMALELFKPFVMNRLVLAGMAHNIKSAKRVVERVRPEVWDILEDVIKDRTVLLNRAPTLHRLGIQAFKPVLIEGSAIQVHPLVCTAYNADFDGDQMAVHVPLSREASLEASRTMLSVRNMLSPSSGEPIVTPTLDMVVGCYYLTMPRSGAKGEGKRLRDFHDARLAYTCDQVDLQAEVLVRDPSLKEGWLRTTVGRIIFNEVLPPAVGFRNYIMDKKTLKELVADCIRLLGNEGTAQVLDAVKELGFRYATKAGITVAINDIEVPEEKQQILKKASEEIVEMESQYELGLVTEQERYDRAVKTWSAASDEMTAVVEKRMPSYGGIYLMAISGAKGNIAQIKQMAGMRGLMTNPKGRIIDLPIKSSFREGLSVLEYFISTHGARKGLADTALRTADSGYLTRRLVDVSQDVIILQRDCGTENGVWIHEAAFEDDVMISPFKERIVGRLAATPITHPRTNAVMVDRNQEINEELADKLITAKFKSVHVRSPLTCDAPRGVCRICYGRSLATGRLALLGDAVGIIAAQSIGEPGTQLTMRTFHTGGVAGVDITSGLPRVEELFEARVPRNKAIMAAIEGQVQVFENGELIGKLPRDEEVQRPSLAGKVIRIVNRIPYTEEYKLPPGFRPAVSKGQWVDAGAILATHTETGKRKKQEKGPQKEAEVPQPAAVVSRLPGKVTLRDGAVEVSGDETDVWEQQLLPTATLLARTGDTARAGQKLTAGVKDPHDMLRILGREAVEHYLVEEVQTVYRNQGVSTNDKHIEVIIRQMLRRVRVENPGDTELLPGQLVDRMHWQEVNAKVLAEGGEPATTSPVLLGVTRASLNTDSFLAAASFQETTRVLTEAAMSGAVDRLLGLKENVIIGRLIPARLDISDEGRKMLGLDEPRPQPVLATLFSGEKGAEEEALLDTEMDRARRILGTAKPSGNGSDSTDTPTQQKEKDK